MTHCYTVEIQSVNNWFLPPLHQHLRDDLDDPGPSGKSTVWTLIFAVLNFRGFRGSTAIRESLVPRKFRPAFTKQRITSVLINSDIIILQNGYRGLGRS